MLTTILGIAGGLFGLLGIGKYVAKFFKFKRLVKELYEFINAIIDAGEDGKWDNDELKKIIEEGTDVYNEVKKLF